MNVPAFATTPMSPARPAVSHVRSGIARAARRAAGGLIQIAGLGLLIGQLAAALR